MDEHKILEIITELFIDLLPCISEHFWKLDIIKFKFSPSPSFSSPTTNILSNSCQSVYSVFSCLCFYFVLWLIIHYIPHVSKIMWYLSFSDWLISLSIVNSKPTHAVARWRDYPKIYKHNTWATVGNSQRELWGGALSGGGQRKKEMGMERALGVMGTWCSV